MDGFLIAGTQTASEMEEEEEHLELYIVVDV